jgi:uracil-DNA glycosylase
VLLGSLGGEGKESGVDKQVAWEALKQQAVEHSGPVTVFGKGSLDAQLAIVGEAPGSRRSRRSARS